MTGYAGASKRVPQITGNALKLPEVCLRCQQVVRTQDIVKGSCIVAFPLKPSRIEVESVDYDPPREIRTTGT